QALNLIFAAWKIRATKEWNISGELCSGAAIDESITIDDKAYNPFIKCRCIFHNSTICRITALKVFAIDVIGPIPPQLWTLTYLTNLKIEPVNAFILYVHQKSHASFFQEPGSKFSYRLHFSCNWKFDSNGMDVRLLKLFGVNALSGPIPKEIGLLTELRSLGIGLNNFSGSIPAEIGNCTKLLKIYLGISGLRGEIPSSFANLVDLEDAWIHDMDVSGPIPEFIGKWTKLTILKILGTGLSGPIPLSFSNLTSLRELSLGDISNIGSSSLEFIKGMKSLSILVLRNSNLTGTIPSNIGKNSNLQQVDLSFNKLHGPIPASLLNLNQLTHLFLGNNTLDGSLPTQKSQTLRNIDVSYNDLSGSLPSWVSLPNLKLNLVANNFTLEGLDKRVLPGLKCLQKNFPCNRGKGIYSDFSINCGGPQIRSATGAIFERDDEDLGSASFVVSDVQRWAASSVGYFAGSSNNIWVVNTLDSEIFQSARQSSSSRRYYGLGLENGGYTVTLQFAEIDILGTNSWRGLGRRRFDIYVQGKLVEKDFDIRKTACDTTVQAVQREYKTNVSENYLEIHLLWAGKGSFSIPVLGTYGPLISAVSAKPVKVLSVGSRHGKGQFVAEIITISSVLHRNLVKLYGCCYEGDHRLLVYEYLPNGSLDHALFGGKKALHLDWPTRFEICLGVARGLAYLHEEVSVRIVHRDVKAINILLDSKLLPIVSDFGLAKLYDDKKTHISTRVAGTIGYLAPEYAMRGHLTEKTDVYAFGVVVLELVSGRPNFDMSLDDEKKYLLEWAWNLHEKSREVELIDHKLTEFNMEEVKRMIGIALLCIQASHALRPPMSKVVAMLSGDLEVSDVTSKPGYLTDLSFEDTSKLKLKTQGPLRPTPRAL
ncbi:hypothetical protein EUTSA_v10019658mg, partial [Eutrema salsugineum]